jgi:hypothetical protein
MPSSAIGAFPPSYWPEQIDWSLVRAHRHRLLETAARTDPRPGQDMPEAVRVTSVGAYHLLRLPSLFEYVDAMIVDTPVIDHTTREAVDDAFPIHQRLDRCDIFREYLDRCWEDSSDLAVYWDWAPHSASLSDEIARIRGVVGEPEAREAATDDH